MSLLGDVFGVFRQVVMLDDRVTKLQADVAAVKADVNAINGRVSRLEGMFEMAMYHEQRRLDRD